MKNLKYLAFLISTLILVSSIHPRKAQLKVDVNRTDNYYDNVSQYLELIPDLDHEMESNDFKQFRRDLQKWWPRLAPSGSITKANEAINAYNCGYVYSPSKYDPNWICIGPTGKPDGASYTGIGQMHRITFDPNYDALNNHTMYAVSNFGGVWKSTTEQAHWTNLNTDKYLPFTTVADVAVHPKHTDVLLLATGDGDYGIMLDKSYTQVTGLKIGPTQTSGIYRSENAGDTWEKINGIENSFCNTFFKGGNTRKMVINPIYPDHAFIATTKGIFRSTNIMEEPDRVLWEHVLPPGKATEWRGLAIKPDGRGKTIYASGSDIYKSTDGGATWRSMTTQMGGVFNGLDFNDFPFGIENCRINITTTPADPERLYAYIFGVNEDLTCEECKEKCRNVRDCFFACGNPKCWSWIYMYKDGKWHKLHENNKCSAIGAPQRRWLGIAASPINPNNVFFGNTNVIGNKMETTYEELLSGKSFEDYSGYNAKGLHADVHAVEFEPKNMSQKHPRLFATTHGGVSYNLFTHQDGNYEKYGSEHRIQRARRSAFKKNWKRIDDGLSVATMHDMDQSYAHPEQVIVALQDNGIVIHKDSILTDSSQWKNILGGDGYATMFDVNTNSAWVNNGKIYRYEYEQRKKKNEGHLMPDDPIDGFRSFTRKFISRAHPQTGKMLTAFAELYERKINYPDKSSKKNDVWKIKSDIGKVVGMGWQRNIGDFQISEADPEYMYIISSGVESFPPQDFYTEPRIFRSTTGGCDNLEEYGDPKSEISCFEHISTAEIETVEQGEKRLPLMKSVAIHNTNPNRIWVAFSGYDPNIKVLMWEYNPLTGKGTWSNADPHNTLNNLPVNFVIHQKGTDNRLYIGTDAGVWIKDEGKDTWEPYGDFPNVRVTAMKANYCSHNLVVGTWGRSAWKGNMLPMIRDYENALYVDQRGPVFWTRNRVLDKNLLVKKGSVLKIDSAVVSMPYNGKIMVEPGATLLLNRATIQNNCGEPWQGILKLSEGQGEDRVEGKVINVESIIRNVL